MSAHQLVRFKKGKNTYELMTKVGSVLRFRDGKLGLPDVLMSEEIWKNVSKGEKYGPSEIQAAFETTDMNKIYTQILNDGELQISAAERREKIEQKRREIVTLIHRGYIDPRSKTPHPVVRIENALTELKVHIDMDMPAERQVKEIVKKLPEVLPIKKQGELEGTLSIPHAHLGAAQGVVRKWCTVKKESYTAAGCDYDISLLPSDYEIFSTDLAKVTKGDFTFNVDGGLAATSEPEKAHGKGRGRGGRKK